MYEHDPDPDPDPAAHPQASLHSNSQTDSEPHNTVLATARSGLHLHRPAVEMGLEARKETQVLHHTAKPRTQAIVVASLAVVEDSLWMGSGYSDSSEQTDISMIARVNWAQGRFAFVSVFVQAVASVDHHETAH